jgi:uncharacterized integral membrane protein (TIGR00698 family)
VLSTLTLPALAGPRQIAPGVALTLVVAAASLWLHDQPRLALASPLIIATLLGMILRNVGWAPAACRPGQAFVLRRLLRAAIVLLGFQISLGQALSIGPTGLGIVLFAVFGTLTFTLVAGRWLKMDPRFVCLIAAGTAICGASAIVAANTVAEAPEEDVAYSIACVTLLGTISIFLYPALGALIGLSPRQFGLWSGGSIHEIAQAVAAAFQGGAVAGNLGTITKLCRVALLAPVVLGLVALRRGAPRSAATPLPWFLLGFVLALALNSLVRIPADASHLIVQLTTLLMAMALGAMGLATDLRALAQRGARPLLLAVGAWVFVMLGVLGLVVRFA